MTKVIVRGPVRVAICCALVRQSTVRLAVSGSVVSRAGIAINEDDDPPLPCKSCVTSCVTYAENAQLNCESNASRLAVPCAGSAMVLPVVVDGAVVLGGVAGVVAIAGSGVAEADRVSIFAFMAAATIASPAAFK